MLPKRYDPLSRLNVVCPYYTMFPLEFPYRVLRKAPKSSMVLDPFCGRGTTLYAARLLNLRCRGIDSNPVAAAIAAAKLIDVSAYEVISLCERIFQNPPTEIDVPEGEFWKWCYNPSTLLEICILRDYLRSHHSTPAEIGLRALVLGILHGPTTINLPSYLSNQMPRTYATKPDAAVSFWERRGVRPKRVNTMEVVRRRAAYIFERVPEPAGGKVIRGDVRTMPLKWKKQFTHVITSPPYLGMRCYVPDQWLRNWFLGADENVTYDESEQIGVKTRDSFVTQLAAVWKRVADVCTRGANLVVRFGALPSVVADPSVIVKESFNRSTAHWKVITCRHVEPPPEQKRQANQFSKKVGAAINEVDVYAALEA